jgi:rhodanese-related sulfurtransferase
VARELAAAGFDDVYALKGGFDAWVAAGLLLEPPTTSDLLQRPQ